MKLEQSQLQPPSLNSSTSSRVVVWWYLGIGNVVFCRMFRFTQKQQIGIQAPQAPPLQLLTRTVPQEFQLVSLDWLSLPHCVCLPACPCV